MKSNDISISKERPCFFSSYFVRALAAQVASFVFSVLMARGAVLGTYAPFGAAFLAAVPYENMLSALLGVTLGYLLPSSINSSVRYIASALAVAAIRWTLSDLEKLKAHPLYVPLVAFVPSLATGLAMASVKGFTSTAVIMTLTETLLSACGAYFFARTIYIFSKNKGVASLDQQAFACVAMSACIAILSFADAVFYGISLGRVVAILAVLLCARYAGIAGGSIAGIASGVIFSLSSTGLSHLPGAYAFGGMMAGLFAPFGKAVIACIFLISNAIVLFEAGSVQGILTSTYEVVISTLIFMVIPASAMNPLSEIFQKTPLNIRTDGLRKSIILRLQYAAKALETVSDSVESVSKKLSKLNTPDTTGIYTKAIDKNCSRCGLKMFCWEREYDSTLGFFEHATNILLENGSITEADFPAEFSSHCCKISKVTDSLNRHYDEFIAKQSADRRMEEVRSVITEQFSGMSDLLCEISAEFEKYETFDFAAAERVANWLKKSQLPPVEVSCLIDKFDRMSVEIAVKYRASTKLSEAFVMSGVSKACGRVMDEPCINYSNDICRIQLSEKPRFSVEVGSAQHVFDNGTFCGDNYCYFNDGRGRMVVLISDGMGTGGRAAVDGAMTSSIMAQLAKVGLGFDCALRIVNSALLVKSGEESLATLDIACIDLFTGKVEFMKAGAPTSFVKNKGKVAAVEAPSLPVGILTDVKFSSACVNLQKEDVILMVSDGVVNMGDDWIKKDLEDLNFDDMDKLAEHIVSKAVKQNEQEDHDDDVTALAIRIRRVG